MSYIRARFVDADGVSFFDEVNENNLGVWLRMEYREKLWPDGSPTGLNDRIGVGYYRREFWVIPCGPLACPIDDPHWERADVVYRFERLDSR